MLYEALPEELALRGYVWSNLRDGWGNAVATVITTAIFPFGGIVISSVAWVTTFVFGGETTSPTFFPAGMDPIVYVVQLALFGLALVAARRIPIPGALFIAVAFHATQLTVNRLVLGGTGWHDAGMTTTFVVPDAIALVLVHIVVAGIAFTTIRRTLERRRAARGHSAFTMSQHVPAE